MNAQKTKIIGLKAILISCLVLLIGIAASAYCSELTNVESDGYLQWLHSLEKVMESRKDSGLEEGNLLFPFDQPGWQGEENRAYRHLSISKAINELEAEWLLKGESKTTSALVALANARNYINLSEYDSALVWFETASVLDVSKNFIREIGREKMATAAANGDSVAMAACITNTVNHSTITGYEAEYILALRWLLIQKDSKSVDLVLKKIESDGNVLSDRLRYWVAFSLTWRAKRSESLEHLRILIGSGGLSRDLTEKQRTWVLFSIPDFLFLAGDKVSSMSLYELLQNSNIPEIATWGRFQIANLDFLAGRYLRASEGFKRVCDTKSLGPWQNQACEMVIVAQEIERIKSEGEPYGASSFYTP